MNRAHVRQVLAAGLLLLSLPGCGFATFTRLSFNDSIKPEDVTFITSGKTTFAEVVAVLGAPDEIIGLHENAGAVVSYHFLDAQYTRVNYGWLLQFVSPVSAEFILAGGGLGSDVFQVHFDSHWVARQQTFAKHVHAARYKFWLFDWFKDGGNGNGNGSNTDAGRGGSS